MIASVINGAVAPGGFVAVLGPSGAGKTRRAVALIFQQFNLIRRLTALDNVLVRRLAHVPTWRVLLRCFPREDRQRALHCADGIVALRAGRVVEDAPAGRLDVRAIEQIYERAGAVAET